MIKLTNVDFTNPTKIYSDKIIDLFTEYLNKHNQLNEEERKVYTEFLRNVTIVLFSLPGLSMEDIEDISNKLGK